MFTRVSGHEILMTWNAARNENELDVKVPKATSAKEKTAPIGDGDYWFPYRMISTLQNPPPGGYLTDHMFLAARDVLA